MQHEPYWVMDNGSAHRGSDGFVGAEPARAERAVRRCWRGESVCVI
jgi:hypothetical protein